MNKIKLLGVTVLMTAVMSLTSAANASGIGFIDYKKVQDNYAVAKDAIKEVDAKGLEIQQFLVDKEKEYKSLDTPVKKKNFEDKTAKEFKVKQDSYVKFKTAKEEAVYAKIKEAAGQVLIEQKLDAVVDYRMIFVGGLDITDLVLQKLNSK